MEPKLIRKDIEYQKKTLIIVSVLVACLFIGGSFSLLSSSDETEEVVTFKTGNFNLEVATEGTLSLEGELPKSYDDGFKSNDITLTLTNTGSLEIGKYEVKLEGDSTTTLEANYIRYSVSEDEGKTYLASKLLSETDNIIYTGYNLEDKKILKVKLWIDEASGSNALKKSYNGKINVELYQNEDTLVDVVKSKLVSNYSGNNESFSGGVVAVNNEGNLYHETNSETIREYRYSGLDVNNYVTFNNETWRIVGVFKDETGEEHVKIVRNEILDGIVPETYTMNETQYKLANNSAAIFWNYVEGEGIGNNNWSTAGIQYFLNTKNDDNSNKGYLSYLKDDAISMIFNAKYYLGTVTYNPGLRLENINLWGIKDTAIETYKNERAVTRCEGEKGPAENSNQDTLQNNETCRVWPNNAATWEGEIALLYPSDYGYSTNSQYWNTMLGFGTFNGTPSDNSWLQKANHDKHHEWLLSPTTSNYYSVTNWDYLGILSHTDLDLAYSIRPCLYLKSNVKINGGTGAQDSPYNLTME